MARLHWLPGVLRAAGLTVVEVDGWRTRGSDQFNPRGLIVHATAGNRTATDRAEIGVLLHGSVTAPPPIAQLYLSRTGVWHVVASGRCNHALTGWAGPLKGLGNTNLIGVEAANDNRSEPWPAAQYESYTRGVAAICRHMGWGVGRVAGHKEHQPAGYGQRSTKTDPTFDMSAFRTRVTHYLGGAKPMATDRIDQMVEHELRRWLADLVHAHAKAVADTTAAIAGITAKLDKILTNQAATDGVPFTAAQLNELKAHAAAEETRTRDALLAQWESTKQAMVAAARAEAGDEVADHLADALRRAADTAQR